jgi:hypothetical protein
MLARTPWRLMTAPRNIYGIASEMGRPVARGEIPLVHADAAIICDTLAQERAGALGPLLAPDVVRLKRHLLRQEVHRHEVARELAAWRIERLVKPMIAAHRPSNVLLAEAHGVNGAAGFPLTEAEVTDVVRREVYWALPRERRHVG